MRMVKKGSTKKEKSMPHFLLRLEGLLLLIIATIVFFRFEGSLVLYMAFFLFPDISLFFYLLGKRIGAVTYNIFHTYLIPGLLILFGLSFDYLFIELGLIWFAHIGIDRALGLGLKYPQNRKKTHFQRI